MKGKKKKRQQHPANKNSIAKTESDCPQPSEAERIRIGRECRASDLEREYQFGNVLLHGIVLSRPREVILTRLEIDGHGIFASIRGTPKGTSVWDIRPKLFAEVIARRMRKCEVELTGLLNEILEETKDDIRPIS